MKSLTLTLALVAALPTSAVAITPDAAARAIAIHSPAVKISQAETEATVEELKAENMLADPTVSLSELMGGIGNKFEIEASQSFDFPTVYHRRGKLIKARETAAEILTQQQLVEAYYQAYSAAIDVAYSYSMANIRDSIAKLAMNRSEAVNQEYERGIITAFDRNRMLRECNAAIRNVNSSERTLTDAKTAFEALGDRSIAPGEITLPGSNTLPSLNACLQVFEDVAPELRLAKVNDNLLNAEKRLLKSQRLPSLSLGAIYNDELGDRFYGFSFGLNLPFYSRKHRTRAAELTAESITRTDSLTVRNLQNRIRAEHSKAMSLLQEIESMDKLMSGDRDMAVAGRMLEVGQLKYSDYCSEIIAMLDARAERLALCKEFHLLKASLTRYDILLNAR